MVSTTPEIIHDQISIAKLLLKKWEPDPWMFADPATDKKPTTPSEYFSKMFPECQRRRQWETNWAFRNGSGTMAGDGNEKGPADRSTGPCRS